MDPIKEACVESLEDAIRAEQNGASRIELCSDLANDGLTPTEDLIAAVLANVHIPVRVMIRPRAGDFVFSDEEVKSMQDSIRQFISIGVEGIVIGAMTVNRGLDTKVLQMLIDKAEYLKITVHKAIDYCDNPLIELRKLLEMGNVDSVLSSGKADTALEGQKLLREMVKMASAQIEIIAAGKITSTNFNQVHQLIGAKAYHGKLIV